MNIDLTSVIQVRHMQAGDLPRVLEIETTVYPFPWTWQIFQDCLHSGYVARVLEVNQQIVGYGLMSIGVEEADILNICVHPHQHRQGYGQRLLKDLIFLAKQNWVNTVFLEVRVSNLIAIQIYQKTGFKVVGKRKNYYPGEFQEREDGLVLALKLGDWRSLEQ